jgi:arylsulfatase A-like enzyme
MKKTAIRRLIVSHRRRQEQLMVADEILQAVIDALREADLLQNTIVIYTSDNGSSQGEHRVPAGKKIVYEEVIRVPLIVSGPGIPRGEQREQLVNNLDLVASIVDWAGAEPQRQLDGKSMVPIIRDPSAPWRSHLLVHGQASHTLAVDIDRTINRFSAVRTNRWVFSRNKLAGATYDFAKWLPFAVSVSQPLGIVPLLGAIVFAVWGQPAPIVEELYDLQADPWQLENKIADPAYASVIATLRARVDTLSTCKGDSCWMTMPEPDGPE